MTDDLSRSAVAIVGIGCRFPGGADTPDAFWRLLCDGVDAITELPPDRFDVEELFDPDPAKPGKMYTRWGGFLESVDVFDADFFGISPREARRMDPQHRLLLEVVWESLEDGGIAPATIAGTSTGVFVGISTHDYGDLHVRPGNRNLIDAHLNIGNALCAAPNRISYLLDLRGPSLAVETACSSSLTAVHLACRSLQRGETEMAVAGGVNLVLAPELTIGFCKASMISPDGRCRAFDAGANGYVRSEGAGAVVLKPLQIALEANDPIYGVIRGTAINEDGRTAGISLPNGEAQEQLFRQALREAGVTPSAVQYVEAHGTGTSAGDPIEAGALGRVFGSGRDPQRPCLIGSAKTNVGHLEAAAGMAGLIKAALCLKHRGIPPSLHFREPNPEIPFDELHLRVPTTLQPWPDSEGPAMAGVNAFGFGGSNAHVILEEPPRANGELRPNPNVERGSKTRVDGRPDAGADSRPDRLADAHLLTISARTPEALHAYAERYAWHLREESSVSLRDLCYTASRRRSHLEHRLAVVGSERRAFIELLEAFQKREDHADVATGRAHHGQEPRVAFAFSGMGPQWWGMGRQLLSSEPVYRETLEECDRLLRPVSGWSLLDELTKSEAESRIGRADMAHVANCAVQVALTALWRSWGVLPDAVVGHSSGEIAAAHVAGALDLQDALYLAYHRGRLQHTLAGTGGMLAASLSPEEAASVIAGLQDRVSLAAFNSPHAVTLSGNAETLEQIAAELDDQDVFCRLLRVDIPYHAPQMAAIRDELLEILRDLKPRPASLPHVSSTTGSWVDGKELDRQHWWQNVRAPVRFEEAVSRLVDDGCDIFLEVGPHPVLAVYLAECLAEGEASADVLPTLRRMEDERRIMLRSLGALHARGRRVDWSRIYSAGTCVRLPTYPWQRERFWFEPTPEPPSRPQGVDTGHPLLGRRLSSPEPVWESELDDPRVDYLNEHVLQDSIVFPGAGYVEMMLASAASRRDDGPVAIEDVEFRKLLFVEASRETILQLHHERGDRSISIHSAPKSQDSSWTLHATGRLKRYRTPGGGRIDVEALRARCTTEMAVDDHFRVLASQGFRYGSVFRGLKEIRIGDGEAVARIEWPSDVSPTAADYGIHPALLDAAFQVIPGAAHVQREAGRPNGSLFPVSIRRITFHRPAGDRFWVHAVVHESDEAFLEGDVLLLDDEGHISASVEGLRVRILEEGRVGHTPERIDWLYEPRWEEMPLPDSADAARLRSSFEVRAAVEEDSRAPEDAPDVSRYCHTVAPALDRLATRYAFAALRELGWAAESHAEMSERALLDALDVVPSHHRLVAELARSLASAGISSSEVARSFAEETAAIRRRLDDLIINHPEYREEAELLRRGGDQLPEILRGTVDVRGVLLTGEGFEHLRRMYFYSPACRSYHALLGDVLAAAESADSRRLRMLEIGAGTGAATAEVLPRLPESAEYTFTDISPYFLAQAREHLSETAGLRFSTLDIEKEPIAQGYEPHAFDLVLAANVLHATADLRTSLVHIRKLLAPGGLLVLLELTRRSPWLNLVFGLLDGWWRFTDFDLRPDYPLLSPKQWESLLEETGFERVANLFEGASKDGLQTVVLADAPAASVSVPKQTNGARRSWLILADRKGVGRRTAEGLQREGHVCRIAFQGDTYRRRADGTYELPSSESAGFERLLDEVQAEDGSPDGIIHLWSLDSVAGDGLTAHEVMEAQRYGCGSALGLIQALATSEGPSPEIWLVTAGSQAVEREEVLGIPQATVWGFGRVLRNEQADVGCRLVDVSSEYRAEEIDALVDELIGDQPEEEVAFRGSSRFVRRLRRISLDEAPKRKTRLRRSTQEDHFRLEIGTPGALDSLLLREAPPAQPSPGELAIRVRAAGLNFREVLQALDMMLPGAEGDPSQGLGVECAGVVVACGEGVSDFRPGDEVIALASPAHASHATVRAYLAIPKPENLSFAESATVMNAFVTADYTLNHVARIAAGERVLIHSAAGAVGHAAIQICRRAGAHVFATAGTPEKRAHLKRMGVEHVMDSRSLDFYEAVLQKTGGEGVDVVLNALTGEAMQKSLDLLRPYGRFVELGKRDIYQNGRLGLRPFRKNLTYTAVDLMQVAEDRPSFANGLLREAVERVADGTWTLVPHTVFDMSGAEEAFRLMAQARHIGKVVLSIENPHYEIAPLQERSPYRSDATYLITGGLGGFGLAAADWLVRHGARHLVLVSRSGTPKENSGVLDALRASAAEVVVMQCDVADEGDVGRVLERIRREMPPLKGILHAAMVLDDALLVELDETRFHSVMAPKVAGAWNLHRLTREDDLDFFVPFSSMASVIGHPMQGNYAAANAFLDTLASHRRAQGLPALSVGWGPMSGVGYVSRHHEVAEYLDRSGAAAFSADEALDTLDMLLQYDVPHVMAARIDWPKWTAKNPVAAASTRFRPVAAAAEKADTTAAEGNADSPLASLQRAAAGERIEIMETYLLQRMARVLGATPEKVDPERPLTELGFDSLMAVELTTAFKVDLGVKLPVVKILKGITGRELAETLLEKLFRGGDENEEEAVEEASPRRSAETGYPLSFEQRRFWLLERLAPGNAAYNLPAAARLIGALDIHAFERSLSEVVRRHEVLRSAIRDAEGEPLQTFALEEAIALPLIDLQEVPGPEREAELQRRAGEIIRQSFDLSEGRLLRAALFRMDHDEHVVLLVVHHIACDAWSINMLVREIAALYEAFSEGRSSPLSDPPFRYADYVRRQQELLTDDRTESQLAYWKKQLADAPAELRLPELKAIGPSDSTASIVGGGQQRVGRMPAGHQRDELMWDGHEHVEQMSGGHKRFELSRELTEKLQALSAGQGVTLFMTLLTVFQALLHRYAGAEDICVGTAVSKRTQPGDEAVAGCFMNTVVLRSDLSGGPTFRQLLQRVRKTTLEAFENDNVPFERVVEAVRPKRALDRTPLFQAMLVLHNARMPAVRLHGLKLEPMQVESGTAVADLMLLADLGEQLTGTLEYSTDILDAPAAERMLGHFVMLLEGMVDDLDQPVSAPPLLTQAERHQMLVAWNDTAADLGGAQIQGPKQDSICGSDCCLHELFESQVQRSPEAVAVVHGDEQLTYDEIDRRSSSLARHLVDLGLQREDLVGVYCGPCVERVVALLGILKAGGAFLPLAPDDALERVGFMMRDAGIPILLTHRRLADTLPEHGAQIVLLDTELARRHNAQPDGAEPDGSQPPAKRTSADDLAYVIYTSGSTGDPKGVMITHAAICNQVLARQEAFPLEDSDVVLQRTPVGFDPFIWEMFGPLSAGACVVISSAETLRDTAGMARLIAKEQVTALQTVPSLLGVLLEEPAIEACSSLKHVFCGGEPLRASLRDRFFERLPDVALHNMYGPAEAAIDATNWTCRKRDAFPVVPIGRPVANVQAYVLDDRRQPVPVGVPGELYLGGAGLARGYLGAPDLTAERFIANPFREAPGSRLYRTGDLARWRAYGDASAATEAIPVLEFLGRRDDQVKIRGHRVEPAEVEAALTQHPAVSEAIVVVRESRAQYRQLVAYIVAEGGGDVSREGDGAVNPDTIRAFADCRLPAYMMPSDFVCVADLPRLASGKVDRRALSATAYNGTERDRPYAAPRNPLEHELVQLWEELLGTRPVGVTDDFFDAGGHSLLAMRLISRIRQSFGQELPPSSLIQHGTVEHLARLLRRPAVAEARGQAAGVSKTPGGPERPSRLATLARAEAHSPIVILQPDGSGLPFVCVHPSSGSILCYRDLARAVGTDRPCFGIQAPASIADIEPLTRIEEMAAEYVAALRATRREEPYLLGGWSMGALIAHEMACRLQVEDEQVGALTLLDPPPVAPGNRLDAEAYTKNLGSFAESLGLPPEQLAVPANFWELGVEEQLGYVFEQVRNAGLMADEVNPAKLRRHLRLHAAHMEAVRQYRPRPFAGSIGVFKSGGEAAASATADGWDKLAGAGLTRYAVPGDHFSMLRDPKVQVLAQNLKSHWKDAAADILT